MTTGPRESSRARPEGLHGWVQERIGIDEIWGALFQRKIPIGASWLYTLGFASIALFAVQMVTGSILAIYYSSAPDHAYDSVSFVSSEVPFGAILRGIHYWGASAMVVTVVLHMIVVFCMGAYKYPREITWVVGVGLFLVTMAFGFTGYLLPWDEKAYWATTVGTNMAGTVPAIGGTLVRFLRGGAQLGAPTLSRFYASHVLLLPMFLAGLVAVHLFLVVRQGVSVPPSLWEAARSLPARLTARSRPIVPEDVRYEEYHRLYDRFKAQGRPFFPDLIVEDALVSVAAVLIVIVVAAIFGAPLESPADPTNTSYVPRPEWYFMFLFELLKYFPGNVEWLGAILLPTLLVVLLVVLPFVDRRPERLPTLRPAAMAIATMITVAIVALTVRAVQTTPAAPVEQQQATRLTSEELLGRRLVESQNCSACHVIAGQGSTAGPSLDGIAGRRAAAYIHSYVENPKSINPAATMPAFVPPLSHAQAEQITKYLETLK